MSVRIGLGQSIVWSTTDCGGGTSSATFGPVTIAMSGTIGQFDAPSATSGSAGGPYRVVGGFWPGVPRPCAADFNHAGGLSVQDIFDFLGAWFAGLPTADFNQSGGLSAQDIFDFLGAWFAGCG